MIEDKIEIVIPTYNRANYLNETLNYLLNSPFKDCKITIRDNASPDETQKICEKYSKLFKNMHIIRNNKNIGGNLNVLLCYEQATYPYVWVLADNDYLNFDKCNDFLEAIESEKYDLIICNSALYTADDSPNYYPTTDDESISEYIRRESGKDENYLENTTQELAHIIKKHYFMIGGFISSTIYKTSLIDTEVLIQGSDYISRSYPHFPLVAKSLNENRLTYKTKYDIVFLRENPGDTEIIGIEWYSRYLDCLLLIENEQLRHYAEEHAGHKIYYEIPARIVYAKVRHDPGLKNSIISFIEIIYKLKGWYKGFLYQIYIMIFYLMPTKLCEYFVKKRLGTTLERIDTQE